MNWKLVIGILLLFVAYKNRAQIAGFFGMKPKTLEEQKKELIDQLIAKNKELFEQYARVNNTTIDKMDLSFYYKMSVERLRGLLKLKVEDLKAELLEFFFNSGFTTEEQISFIN